MGSNGIWCAKCARYLTFDTYNTSTVGALIKYLININTKSNN